MAEKLNRIKALAEVTSGNTASLDQCKSVLSKLYTACDPSKETCSDPNIQTFQVSIDHVCGAVKSTKKLSVETIGDEFDGFTGSDSIRGGEDCEALSYDVCRNFVSELDRLYEASGEINPMRKNPSISLHDKDTQNVFQHTQFPTEYQFPQDARGIVDKSFNYDSTSHVGGAFHLINQSSGKALVLTAGTQVSAICLQSMSF